jgi:hypothetical protein
MRNPLAELVKLGKAPSGIGRDLGSPKRPGAFRLEFGNGGRRHARSSPARARHRCPLSTEDASELTRTPPHRRTTSDNPR